MHLDELHAEGVVELCLGRVYHVRDDNDMLFVSKSYELQSIKCMLL